MVHSKNLKRENPNIFLEEHLTMDIEGEFL